MAMTIGELVGYIRADDSAFRRGVNRAQSNMERLRASTAARLRDMRERFVSASHAMANALSRNVADATQDATDSVAQFTRDSRGRLRNARGHFVSEAEAIAQGFTEAIESGADEGMTGLRGRFLRHLRQMRSDLATRTRSMWGRLTGASTEAGEESGHGMARGMLSRITSTLRSGIGSAVSTGLSGLQSITGQQNPYVAALVLALVTAVATALGPALGAVLGGLVVSAVGIGVVGLSAMLVKDEPKVKAAATRLVGSAKKIFKDAAKPMVKPISDALASLEHTTKTLAPKFKEVFKAAADSGLTKSLTKGIDEMVKRMLPGLITMLQKASPVFEGLAGLLGRVGAGLGSLFTSLGQGSPQMGQALADLGWLLEKTITGIGYFLSFLAQMYGKVRPFIVQVIGLFEWLYDVLVGHSIIPDLVNAIIGFLASLPGRAAAVLSGLPGAIISRAQDAATRAHAAIQSGVDSAVRTLSSLPGRARGALSGLGSTLYNAGRSLVGGFVNGIHSMLGAVQSAANAVVSTARRFFPFSPAKEGPFSGRGWTLYSGQALAQGFAAGIESRRGAVASSLGSLMGPGMALPGAAAAGVRAPAVARGGPTRVIIEVRGPEEVVRLIRTAVAKNGGDVQKYLGNK
ncbi:hypothetical protein [Streptomyces sp. NPDC086023]|uniref:hypothetical protein n=1 Tax=Streptomyces sp. NPDC086023 TaxID=3365746 RepID=UPI0037D90662